MSEYSNPVRIRVQGGGLGVTIPNKFVREMGLVAGDTALVKLEPDGLKFRIIRQSKLVELAEKQESAADAA